MIIVCRHNAEEKKIQNLISTLEDKGMQVHYSKGTQSSIIGIVGDTSKVDMENLQAIDDVVEKVQRVSEPYKLANRKFHEEDTVITVGDTKIGGNNFGVINQTLTSIDLPVCEKIGDNFLVQNRDLKELNLPMIQSIGEKFLISNASFRNFQVKWPFVSKHKKSQGQEYVPEIQKTRS